MSYDDEVPEPSPDRYAGMPPLRPPRLPVAPFIIGALVLAIALLGGVWLRTGKSERRPLAATAARFTLIEDTDGDTRGFAAEQSPDIYYRVTLHDAPRHERLSLDCEWLNPSGQAVLANHYQTRVVTTSVWNTHCHQQFGRDAPRGQWQARILFEGRVLRQDAFELR
jgi:hypothetical protein